MCFLLTAQLAPTTDQRTLYWVLSEKCGKSHSVHFSRLTAPFTGNWMALQSSICCMLCRHAVHVCASCVHVSVHAPLYMSSLAYPCAMCVITCVHVRMCMCAPYRMMLQSRPQAHAFKLTLLQGMPDLELNAGRSLFARSTAFILNTWALGETAAAASKVTTASCTVLHSQPVPYREVYWHETTYLIFGEGIGTEQASQEANVELEHRHTLWLLEGVVCYANGMLAK